MAKTYLKVTLQLAESEQELFISNFDHVLFTGFEQRSDEMDAYLAQSDYSEQVREEIQIWLRNNGENSKLLSEESFEHQNWNENWEKSLKPVRVDPFFITPTWMDDYKNLPELIPVFIDPKMAFGTGYHETTRLVMRLLPHVISGGERVLDVGTGTGILAIGALKLGGKSAVGVDIDEWSYDNAMENAERNEVSENFLIRGGSLEAIPESEQQPFDVVLANINRNALLELSQELVAQVKDGGFLVISGLLAEDETTILANSDYMALRVEHKKQENDWIALVFQK